MKHRSVLLISVFLASCSLGSEGPERAEFWKNEVDFLNTEKIGVVEALERYAGYAPIFDETQSTLTIIETGEANSLVCSKWHYIVIINFSEAGIVEGASLSETGACL